MLAPGDCTLYAIDMQELGRNDLERRFGSEEALGIQFARADGGFYSPAEMAAYWLRPEADLTAEFPSQFADGTDAICCTNYAIHVVRGVHPVSARIMGFANIDNPRSRVAREEIHPAGHDFAIVADRYLVDPWIVFVAGYTHQIVFDLSDPRDAATVLDLYGPAECWTPNIRAMEAALRGVSEPQKPHRAAHGQSFPKLK